MADDYWDHPSRRETKRLIDLADVGAILDELQNQTTEWDDAREALDNLVRGANYANAGLNEALAATETERDAARAEVEQWRATFGESALRDGLARMARAEAERDRLAEQVRVLAGLFKRSRPEVSCTGHPDQPAPDCETCRDAEIFRAALGGTEAGR